MGTFKEGLSKNIYRDVLADLVPSLKAESDLHTQKRPKYEHYYVGGRTSEQTDVDFIDPIEVADLLDHCRTMSLAEEREALMDQLVVASKSADPSAFGKIPEPEKPRDWAQARTGCRNGCGDCSQLNSFLTNPQERTRGFAMAEKRRRHLANQLSHSGCTLDTEHRGIPYTLVVTQTEKKWHEHHKAWRERCRVAGKSFISIGIAALQEILGEDYERAVDLKSRKAGSAADGKPGAAVEAPARSLTRKTPVSTRNQPVPFPTAILAKAQQAARRSLLGAVTQSLVPSTNELPNKPREGVSKVEIIDLTIE
ncbi:MAG: hypothetical protein Q9199_004439 [Rusavskia elegans]